jgi:hypothetical protein
VLLGRYAYSIDGSTKNAEEKSAAVVIINDDGKACLCFSPKNDFLDIIIFGSVEFMS